MRVVVASDHAGFALKRHVATTLRDAGHDVVDVGADSEEPVDYPQFAAAAARMVAAGGGAGPSP
jgi:ribose 5-phosphate isomerase B